jgi:hypothetical protein
MLRLASGGLSGIYGDLHHRVPTSFGLANVHGHSGISPTPTTTCWLHASPSPFSPGRVRECSSRTRSMWERRTACRDNYKAAVIARLKSAPLLTIILPDRASRSRKRWESPYT